MIITKSSRITWIIYLHRGLKWEHLLILTIVWVSAACPQKVYRINFGVVYISVPKNLSSSRDVYNSFTFYYESVFFYALINFMRTGYFAKSIFYPTRMFCILYVSSPIRSLLYPIFLLTGLRIYTGEYKAQGPTLCPTKGRALRGPRAVDSPV